MTSSYDLELFVDYDEACYAPTDVYTAHSASNSTAPARVPATDCPAPHVLISTRLKGENLILQLADRPGLLKP